MSSNPLDQSSKSHNGPAEPLERRLDIVVTQGASPQAGSFLLVVGGDAAGKLFPLNKPNLLIGRSPNADIRINEKAVSHKHATVNVSDQRYTIRDLGSTNGTLVNGEVSSSAVELQGGDSISIGSTTLTFLSREDQDSFERTQQLNGGSRPAAHQEGQYLDSLRSQPSLPPAGRYASAYPIGIVPPEDDSLSFTDVLQKINTYWLYTKRYGWLVATCTCFGVAAGILQTRLSPPPGSAWFEVILSGGSASAPGEDEGRGGVPIFLSPQSTFRSLPLIKKTWKELEGSAIDDDLAGVLQRSLTFEQEGYQSPLWRGEFQGGTSEQAVRFLTKHLDVYLDNEIDKKLNLIRSPRKVMSKQAAEAKETMRLSESRLFEFRNKYPKAVPRDVPLPNRLEATLKSAKSVAGQINAVQAEMRRVEKKLTRGTSLKKQAVERSRKLRDDASAKLKELSALRASGLKDQHPDIRRLQAEFDGLQRLAKQVEREGATELERETDAERLQLNEQLRVLRVRLRDLDYKRAQANKNKNKAELEGETLPVLQARYQELSRAYESAEKDYQSLTAKLRNKTLELENARAHGENHYDITTPPTGKKPSVVKATVKHAGLGGFVGLFLAVFAAGILELRARIRARRPH